MKLFYEWLNEAAGIATSRSQCTQGDQPSFAGACSNIPPKRTPKKKKRKMKKVGSKLAGLKKKLKKNLD